MTIRSASRRRTTIWATAALSAGVVAALAGSPPAAVSAAPASAPPPTAAATALPVEDCAEPFPVADLAAGDPVDGLTVTRGTVPETFTGEVLGVLDDGIAVDLDMVMVELDMPEFDRTSGVWHGMSGSPVYAADGRLIGAVAYGLAWGPSPIAGVTPFEEMDDYLGTTAPGRIAVDRRTARTIAARTEVTAAQAEEGFTQLRMPLGISGLSPSRLARAARVDKPYAPKDTYSIGRASAEAAGPESIVAGGNVAASVAYGDITMAGVGTATSVCGGEVVGFGHPLAFLGSTTESLHPADALFIQPESLGAPFKVANVGAPAGTVAHDRLTGITGAFGAAPEAADVTSSVSYRSRSRVGSTHVTVSDFMADAVFSEFLANHERVVDGSLKGTEVQDWTIAGTRADGSAFELSWADRYTSTYDVTFASVFDLADLVYTTSSLPGVDITSVDVDSRVTDETGSWRVAVVQQWRQGRWTKVTRKSPAQVRAGKTLRLRLILAGPAGHQAAAHPLPRAAQGARVEAGPRRQRRQRDRRLGAVAGVRGGDAGRRRASGPGAGPARHPRRGAGRQRRRRGGVPDPRTAARTALLRPDPAARSARQGRRRQPEAHGAGAVAAPGETGQRIPQRTQSADHGRSSSRETGIRAEHVPHRP